MKNHPKDFQERIEAIMEIDDGGIGGGIGPSFPGVIPNKAGQLDRIEAKLDLLLDRFGISPSRKIG
jgi:hypothetical protein